MTDTGHRFKLAPSSKEEDWQLPPEPGRATRRRSFLMSRSSPIGLAASPLTPGEEVRLGLQLTLGTGVVLDRDG